MTTQPVLIDGEWRASAGTETFQAMNPSTGETLSEVYPVSSWEDIDAALSAAAAAFETVRNWPGERFAQFLEAYADAIEARTDALVEAAYEETGLPKSPRLKDGELPRTTGQLRQAAEAARTGSFREPIIDEGTNIRSMLAPIGPVAVFGPNNFPYAFNGMAGGDFAAAIAAGNPVIGKGHPSHPTTSRLFGEAAHEAATKTDMPSGFVQLLYRTGHADGAKWVSDPRMGAVGYTGGRTAGLALKEAADRVGTPIYLELSSVNPVVVLPGALGERSEAIADEFATSCLMGTGQFCTNPGLVLLLKSDATDVFLQQVKSRFESAADGVLLGEGTRRGLLKGIETLTQAGATIHCGGSAAGGDSVSVQNTLLSVTGDRFLTDPETFQTEAFGNATLFVKADSPEQLAEIVRTLEGNLTGSIYSDTSGSDDSLYDAIEPHLRWKVGRLLNDKMPTGVAVVPSMNHGGPFPATGHPGVTAVGLPTSIRRFCMLQCYDNVRPERLPETLK